MNKLATLIIAGVVVVGGGVSFALVKNNNDKKTAHNLAMQHEAAMKKDEAADGQLSSADAAMEKKGETGDAMAKGSYSDYDQAKLANAEKGKVVLNFSAPWCPICREADKNFKASATPDGLTLLKVDYDSSTDLKKKYGVTYQHTFVQVDKEGKLLKKWSGSTSYDDLKAQLN